MHELGKEDKKSSYKGKDYDSFDDELIEFIFFKEAVEKQEFYILREVLAHKINISDLDDLDSLEGYEDIEIDNLKLKIKLEKLEKSKDEKENLDSYLSELINNKIIS